jgi:hypothetical protein
MTTCLIRLGVAVVLVLSCRTGAAQSDDAGTDAVETLVARIQRADYEGDRAALQRLYEQLSPRDSGNGPLGSRVRYWRGFALWRRAFNGFNESPPPADLARDLETAIREFDDAVRLDAGFVDAKVGAISCMQALASLSRNDPERIQELVPRFMQLFKESLAAAPDNPRLLWVYGAQQWYNASQGRGDQETAKATYLKGLGLARKQKTDGPLEPAWGEPELLMSLAWSSLNAATPDAQAAEEYARQALTLVPHWHYVRDILMPQIRGRKDRP